jgi:hypothetical protein
MLTTLDRFLLILLMFTPYAYYFWCSIRQDNIENKELMQSAQESQYIRYPKAW